MSNSVRISKPAILEALNKYLEKDLANKIFYTACDIDEHDRKNMIGMTCKEWSERFDDDWEIVWADDTGAGFGKCGDSVYGNVDDCIICRTDYDGHRYRLWVWCESLHSNLGFIHAAIKTYSKQHDICYRGYRIEWIPNKEQYRISKWWEQQNIMTYTDDLQEAYNEIEQHTAGDLTRS